MRALACVVFSLAISGCWSDSQPAQPAQPKKLTVKEIVQPVDIVQQVKIEKVEEREPEGEEGEEGEEDGVVGGEVGGVVGGDPNGAWGGAPPPPPPPPPPAPPTNVAPQMLEALRISGDKRIVPDDITKVEIERSGKDKLVGSFKLCLDNGGSISTVSMLKSSGFSQYDTKIMTTIRNTWRYQPYAVNGQPRPVCTAVTFIYSQAAPPPPPPHP